MMHRKKLIIPFLLFSMHVFAQTTSITGKIIDENNDPIPGVNVLEKGTSNGAVTDFSGEYKINIDNPENATIIYRFIGYKTQEILVAGRSNIDVNMSPESKELDEYVVVGYGKTTVKELTGATAKVKGENIEKLNMSRMDQALQGQVSGVSINTNSGSPGGSSSIRIRGLSTFGDNDPLILVDRVVYDSEGLNALNPGDIESINVL